MGGDDPAEVLKTSTLPIRRVDLEGEVLVRVSRRVEESLVRSLKVLHGRGLQHRTTPLRSPE